MMILVGFANRFDYNNNNDDGLDNRNSNIHNFESSETEYGSVIEETSIEDNYNYKVIIMIQTIIMR